MHGPLCLGRRGGDLGETAGAKPERCGRRHPTTGAARIPASMPWAPHILGVFVCFIPLNPASGTARVAGLGRAGHPARGLPGGAGRRRAAAASTATAGLQGRPTVASVERTPSFEGQRRRAMHEAPSSRFIARLPLANGVPGSGASSADDATGRFRGLVNDVLSTPVDKAEVDQSWGVRWASVEPPPLSGAQTL